MLLSLDYNSSRLFGMMPQEMFDIFTTRNVTINYHYKAVTPKVWLNYKNILHFIPLLFPRTVMDPLKLTSKSIALHLPNAFVDQFSEITFENNCYVILRHSFFRALRSLVTRISWYHYHTTPMRMEKRSFRQ